MKPIIAWFANNHVAANLLMGIIILAGLVSIPLMPMKIFPDMDIPIISVKVPYLGAAPEEVETGVCIRIEEELGDIVGIKQIRSAANEGICSVQIELFENADEARALDDVKNRVDAIDTFPEETEKPIVQLLTRSHNVLDIAITGPENERALKELGQQIRDDIAQLPKVTQVSIANARPYEISIEVSEASLRRHSLTFDQIAAAVRSGSLDLPGGSIKTKSGEILLRTKGQAYWGHEFEKLVITTRADGTRLHLRDVAKVVDGFAETDQSLRFNGKPATLIRVSRVGEQDLQDVSRDVKQYIKDVQQRLPDGITLTIWNDGSELLQDRLNTLLNSGRQGFLMVLILLALFLRPRLAFWVSIGVPVAFLGAIFLTHVIGSSIDAISLFGFILVLGILVDDAIVVGESVHSQHQRGSPRLKGAIDGAQGVTIPVTFGVLTTVAAFMPLLFAAGYMGQIMWVIASTVLCCLIFSLIESQLVLPAHLGNSKISTASGEVSLMLVPIMAILLLGVTTDLRTYIASFIALGSLLLAVHLAGYFNHFAQQVLHFQTRFAEGLEAFINNQFRHLSEFAMAARYVTVAIALAALMSAVGIIMSGRLPYDFFPPLASDQVIARLTMPLGTSSTVTNEAIMHLERSGDAIRQQLNAKYAKAPPVTYMMAAVGDHPSLAANSPGNYSGGPSGSANGHLGEVIMQLTPSQSRKIKTREVANLWRDRHGAVADAVELKFNSSLFSAGNAIDIQLEGSDVDELRAIAEQLRFKLAEYPGVIDITDSFRSGKQELKLSILPGGEALGLNLGSLARQARQAFYGEEAQRIQRGRDDVRVMVRYTEAERRSLGALDSMRIRTPRGSEVPFATVAEAELGRGFSAIRRADNRRVVNVIADVDRTLITATEVIAALRAGPIQEIMQPYSRVSYSLEGSQRDQSDATSSLIPLSIAAIFVIFTLLAVPLRSYSQPLIIMSVIPFAFVGAIWGHLIMKVFGFVSGLAMMSILGFVAASGVVVNSSLVLVHSVNARRLAGNSIKQAVIESSISRCRPILLTSLTTFVGLLPLMLNKSVQAQFLVPMAVSLAFGVLFATLVTLLVVPSGYLILDDIKKFFASSLIPPEQESETSVQ